MQQKQIAVDVAVSGPLPEVEGDSKLLSQVFTNILVERGTGHFCCARPGHHQDFDFTPENSLLVVFADDGPGISQEIVDKIYDPFFTTKRPGGGSGLGLTICLGVIKDHGGRIEVQTPEGTGATFKIMLPAAEAKPLRTARPRPKRNVPQVSSALRGRKLLIVDDEESIREIVQEGLSARGMKVESAGQFGRGAGLPRVQYLRNHTV